MPSLQTIIGRSLHYIRTERRLPGSVVNARAVQLLPWLLRPRASGAPDVVVDAPGLKSRYLYQMVSMLALSGREVGVVLPDSPAAYRELLPEGRLLFRLPGVGWCAQPPPGARWYVTDHDGRAVDADLTIRLDYRIHLPPPDAYLEMPYPVYPFVDFRLRGESLEPYRNRERTVAAFFSGNLSQYEKHRRKWAHDGRPNRAHMGRPERLQVIGSLLERTPPDRLEVIGTPAGRRKLFRRTEPTEKLVIATVKSSPERWPEELSRCRFFVAAPGNFMPPCHNAVESLALGVVPIISYPEWFRPHLQDGVNCLVYRDLVSLHRALDRALGMGPEEVRRLQEGAARYYDAYLDPRRVLQRLEGRTGEVRLFMNIEEPVHLQYIDENSLILAPGGAP